MENSELKCQLCALYCDLEEPLCYKSVESYFADALEPKQNDDAYEFIAVDLSVFNIELLVRESVQ